jgi:protease-4
MADEPPITASGLTPPAGVPLQPPAAPVPPAAVPPALAAPGRRGDRWGILGVLLVVLLGLSVVANGVLLVVIFVLVGSISGGGIEDNYIERIVERGTSSHKIAVIRVEGLIDEFMVASLRGQMVRAAEDKRVKAVILRIDSPGGGLTASDMIYNDVKTLLKDKPVLAAMDGLAASGGYYVACSTSEIVAQPTTITGSIGVIAEFFFLKGLLTDKLGVQIVTLKMGSQKDWGSMFAVDMPPEQQEYFMSTLLKPGYDHFVDIVAKSRKLPRDKVVSLATGRIYMAKEAKESGLIDEIGYFDRAIELAKQKAGIKDARVVEYIQQFRFLDLLGASSASAKSPLGFDLKDLRPEKLAALASPRIMYLWTGF